MAAAACVVRARAPECCLTHAMRDEVAVGLTRTPRRLARRLLRNGRGRTWTATCLIVIALGASFAVPRPAAAQGTSTPTSVVITPPGGTAEPGTLTGGANGTFQVTVPFRDFAMHEIEFRDATGAVVDSASVTVTSVDGSTIDVTTTKGGHLVLTVSHHGGPNGAPSMGAGTYTPPAAAPATTSTTTTTTTTRVPTTPSEGRLPAGGAPAPASSTGTSKDAWWIALIALGVVLVGAGAVSLVRRRREPPDYDTCGAIYGWSVTVKWELSEPYSFLGASEEQAARNGNQRLRNRLTVERPAIDKYLQDYADSITCRSPCTKRVEFKESPEHWDEPVARGDHVVCYVRKNVEVIIYCDAPPDPAPGGDA